MNKPGVVNQRMRQLEDMVTETHKEAVSHIQVLVYNFERDGLRGRIEFGIRVRIDGAKNRGECEILKGSVHEF